MSLNRKHIAFTLAGAFFVLVCVVIAAVVTAGWSAATGHSDGSRIRNSATNYYEDRGGYATAENVDRHGGRLVATVDGYEVELPTLKTDYDVEVLGDLVAVELTQRFENPGDLPLDATYQFPLPEDAAVHAVRMRIGDEVVHAKMQRRTEARKTYEEAKSQGKAAVLTQQHRPNLFQQSLGNLMLGQPVEVELRYVHTADRKDGRYHVTLPLVVGPRYNPSNTPSEEKPPAHPPVQELDAPETIDRERVGIEVRIDAGMPLVDVASDTHAVDVERLGDADARIGLADRKTVDNRHFGLTYGLAAETTQAGLLADWDPEAERGYFSVLVEPPAKAGDEVATPREMVFVLDCSGSMSGKPMEASKAFMRRALRNLRPTDTFRIIRFSDVANEYATSPIEATDENVRSAIRYVNGLEGGGGTEMTSGIEQAFDAPDPDGTIRLVTFLTDGYIGNEFEIVTLVREKIGDARLFSIGVGTGVNRYLLEEMARSGRGFARYVDPTEDVDAVAAELTERLQTPVLTDISIAGTDAGFSDFTPVPVPDLFAGESVRIGGTYTKPGRHRIWVRGDVAGEGVEIPVEVELPGEATAGEAVRLTWARAQIADRMHLMSTPYELRHDGADDVELEREITELGLEHSLMTRFTSFVAVSHTVVNPEPADSVDAPVPVPQVDGVGERAYGRPSVSGPSNFGGGTTPEPGIIGGLLLTLLAGGAAARRRT